MEKVDFIVVGQGLAGSVLSFKLIEKGYKTIVYDVPEDNISSVKAAGIFNPVTGKRLVKTWMADELFPALMEFYKNAERVLKGKFLYELRQYRPFATKGQANDFSLKSGSEEYGSLINSIEYNGVFDFLENPFGGVFLGGSGYVDTNSFLSAVRKFLLEQGSFRREYFQHSNLNPEKNVYGSEWEYKYLIFTDGWKGGENPFFQWLPFRPVKGDILEIEIDDIPRDTIFNKKIFMLPQKHLKSASFLVGSTYFHNILNDQPTVEGRVEIEEKLHALLKVPYRVLSHWAGVRPSTPDRRPFAGFHPNFETIGTVNGLGSKGVSLAPYFIDNFINFVERKEEIIPDIDINRYFSLI